MENIIDSANNVLHINFTTPHYEFCNHLVKLIKIDSSIQISNVFIEAFNYFIFGILDETSLFNNYKYLSSDKYFSYYDPEPITLDNYIDKGYLILKFYKIQFDGVKNSCTNEIKVELPDYLLPEWGVIKDKINTKKKILKTKEVFTLELQKVGLKKESFEYIKSSLSENYYIKYAIKKHPLRCYIDEYTCITNEDSLPLPIVVYPKYGIIGFKTDVDSKNIYFCTCAKQAIINYISMRLKTGNEGMAETGIISHRNFPKEFVDSLSDNNYLVNDSIIEHFQFKDNICHECRKKIPMGFYHGFSSLLHKIGWYVDKCCLLYGIDLFGHIILEDKCPEYIKSLYYEINVTDRIERQRLLEKRSTAICRAVENEVRNTFGFRKIGESWITETTLYYEIKNAFHETEVIHHGKPEFLTPQHLDIWLPKFKVAIEYQGEQHYKPVSVFGGEEGHKKILELDAKKYDLCAKNGVYLIYVNGEYNITDVISTIREYIINLKSSAAVNEGGGVM